MTNPNDPAFARPVSQLGPGETSYDQDGLTKRELFAAMAMQGQLASMTNADVVRAWKGETDPEAWCARSAIAFADALIAELSK